MTTLMIALGGVAAYIGAALGTMRYLYGLWRAEVLDKLLSQSVEVQTNRRYTHSRMEWTYDTEWRERTLEEALRLYRTPSRDVSHNTHEDDLLGAVVCGVLWPFTWAYRLGRALMRPVRGGLLAFVTGSQRKPVRQLEAEARAAKAKIAELERELGWETT